MDMATKRCGHCEQDKSLTLEHWLPRKESRDGFRGTCRLCWYAQQNPNKRRHYRRHADRLKAKSRQWRKSNPERARLRDMRYALAHREEKLVYNRRYYWANHERLLAYARWYGQNVRPMRVDLGPDMPNDRNVDMYVWQQQQSRQQAQRAAIAILTLAMRSLTPDERKLLMVFESHGYDLSEAANAMRLPIAEAEKLMKGIRNAATRSRELVSAGL
jgi:DNA-directed RNA polymerase specialized sigma24 family protein